MSARLDSGECMGMNQVSTDTARGDRRWLALLLICIVGGVIYSPSLYSDFSCDDICFIAWAKYATPLDYLRRFTPQKGEMMYRPLFVALWSLHYLLFGDRAPLYYVLVTAAHLCNAWILFLISSRLSRCRAVSLATALLFVSTPLAVETVSWINGIDDLYCMMFLLLSLYWFTKIDERAGARRGVLPVSLLFGLMALLTRESAVTLPLAVLLFDCIVIRAEAGKPLGAYLRRRWRVHACYVLLLLSFFGVRTLMLGGLMGYVVGGKTYVPPLADIAWNAFLRLPALFVLPLKFGTIQNLVPHPLVGFVAQPYLPIAACVLLSALFLSRRRSQWRLILLGLAWCGAGILAHWQVLHSIGLVAQNLEFTHYLYQPAAGFCLAVGALLLGGPGGKRRKIAACLAVVVIVFYSAVSFSYCDAFRRAFTVAQTVLRQFREMRLRFPPGSRVFLMDVPADVEGARVWWGGTSIAVWCDPEPSIEPVMAKGLWHYTLEPTVRARYPYRIFMLNRDVWIEERRNEYEAAPRFTLDYLRSLKPGRTDHFLRWLPGEERLVDISGLVCERASKAAPAAVSWGGRGIGRGGAWAPCGDARWGVAGRSGAGRLSIGPNGGGLRLEKAQIPPDEFAALEMDVRLLTPGSVEAALDYRTEEEDWYDGNRRVLFTLSAAPGFAAVRVPLTRRIYDLIDGRITGLKVLFPAGAPVELEIRSISLR